MRKKFVKSSRPTYKKRVTKAQQGMRFASYNAIETPRVDLTDITNPVNPFSEYNFNTTYDKPEALVVPVREDSNTELESPVVTDVVVNKPVTKTAKSTWKSPYTNRKQWTTELTNAYKKAGITNDNAIRMLLAQDALESSWGKSAQGKYNFGNLTTGSSWKGDYVTGNDKNAKGEAIKQKFRSYNSMDEYAADKVQFLKRLYDFDENDDINKFVAKLTGSNRGKRRYAEAGNYAKVLSGVYNGIPKGQKGLVVNRRDAIKDNRPNIPNRIKKATPAEHIQSMIDIYGQSEQPVVTSDTKSPWQHQQAQVAASKGYDDYMQAKKYEQGLDRLNQFLTFTDYATLATGLGSLATKGASYAGKQVIKRGAKPLVTNKYINMGNAMNTNTNVINASNNFIEYLNQPETIQRLSSIDKELGTNYIKAIDQFKKDYKSGNIKLIARDKLDKGKEITSNNAVMPDFLERPSYDNMVTTIVRTDPPHTVGHEYKHAIEYMQQFINNAPLTEEKFFKDFANSARLKKMFDADNIVSKEQFAKSYKAQYPMASDNEIERYYDYLTKPTEFSSNLHPLIESNMIKGKPGVPNFKNISELDDAVNNTYISVPYNDPMMYTKIIYNHLIKDKERFRQIFNKYGYGIAAPIGMSVLNAKESNK